MTPGSRPPARRPSPGRRRGLRRRLVAARGHLPGLPAQLRRQRMATASAICRASSSASTTSRPGSSGSMRSGSRRSTRRPGSTSATTSPTTTSVDPVFGGDADVRSLRRRGASARHPDHARPGDEPHQLRHRWFQASRASRDNPYGDWYLWRDPSGHDADGRAAAAEQLDVVLRRFRLALGRAPPPVLHAHVPAEQPDVNWRNPAVEAAHARDGPRLARARRRWLPARCLQRVLQASPSCSPTPTIEGATLWARQATSTTRTGPSCPTSSAEFRAIVDELPGPDDGRRAVRQRGRARGRADDRAPHGVRLRAARGSPGRPRRWRRRSRLHESMFGDERWPPIVLSNHDQSRQASRLAASTGIADTDAVAKAAAVVLASRSAARRSCTTARRSACATSRSRSTRSSTRRRGVRWWTPTSSRGGTATSAARRCRGRARRDMASRPAVRGCASADDAGTRNVAAQARRRRLRPVDVPSPHRPPPRERGAALRDVRDSSTATRPTCWPGCARRPESACSCWSTSPTRCATRRSPPTGVPTRRSVARTPTRARRPSTVSTFVRSRRWSSAPAEEPRSALLGCAEPSSTPGGHSCRSIS